MCQHCTLMGPSSDQLDMKRVCTSAQEAKIFCTSCRSAPGAGACASVRVLRNTPNAQCELMFDV